jgi:hypothetical protein
MTKSPQKKPAVKSADKVRTEPVRTMNVEAGPCEKHPHHINTRVYRTVGQTRYCVCDDCGHTYKRIGPPAATPALEA